MASAEDRLAIATSAADRCKWNDRFDHALTESRFIGVAEGDRGWSAARGAESRLLDAIQR